MMKNIIRGFLGIILAGSVFFSNQTHYLAYAVNINQVSVEQPTYGYVRLYGDGTLNVRQEASTTSKIISSLRDNSPIMIVGESGDFYKVQYSTSSYYGYVYKDYVEYKGGLYGHYLKVNDISGNLNMRSTASTAGSIVGKIPANKSFAYDVGPSNGWYYGIYANVGGFVSESYVTKISFQ